MEGWSMVILVVVIVAAVLLGVTLLIPYLIKKGVNMSSAIATTGEAIQTADLVVDGLTGIFPETKALAVVDKIIEYAKQGVKAAEQMYKASLIEADKRKAEATNIIFDCLKVAEIEITPEVQKVVQGLIEAAVFVMPKTNEGETAVSVSVDIGESATAEDVSDALKVATEEATKAVQSN